jgi:hypothetical protein
MSTRLLLDEHYAAAIAEQLREQGHDVIAVVEEQELRAQADAELFRWAASRGRRIVTENIKDFRPLLLNAYTTGEQVASLLLVSPRRFPRGSGERTHAIAKTLGIWLGEAEHRPLPDEDWLV